MKWRIYEAGILVLELKIRSAGEFNLAGTS
jgi:hypothetical protein